MHDSTRRAEFNYGGLAIVAGVLLTIFCVYRMEPALTAQPPNDPPLAKGGRGGSSALVKGGTIAVPDNSQPSAPDDPFPYPPDLIGVNLTKQTDADASRKSAGCVQCHQNAHDPHGKDTVRLGCTDCHGGNAETSDYNLAHVFPKYPDAWRSSANPMRSFALLNHENPAFVRFV